MVPGGYKLLVEEFVMGTYLWLMSVLDWITGQVIVGLLLAWLLGAG